MEVGPILLNQNNSLVAGRSFSSSDKILQSDNNSTVMSLKSRYPDKSKNKDDNDYQVYLFYIIIFEHSTKYLHITQRKICHGH